MSQAQIKRAILADIRKLGRNKGLELKSESLVLQRIGELYPAKHDEEIWNIILDDKALWAKKKPKCRLVGQDGNVFNIIGLVGKALTQSGDSAGSKEFMRKAMTECSSYDQVLQLVHEYVDVS